MLCDEVCGDYSGRPCTHIRLSVCRLFGTGYNQTVTTSSPAAKHRDADNYTLDCFRG